MQVTVCELFFVYQIQMPPNEVSEYPQLASEQRLLRTCNAKQLQLLYILPRYDRKHIILYFRLMSEMYRTVVKDGFVFKLECS